MEKFIINGKLNIPPQEIENVYIWTQISNTQEVLFSSRNFYDRLIESFNRDVITTKSVLEKSFPDIKNASYLFPDYLTFILNNHMIFNDTTCFCYTTSKDIVNSLVCYLSHKLNKYDVQLDSIASLIINKVNEPDRFTELMEKDFIILQDFSTLPEHKYRNAIFDAFLSRRCRSNLITVCYLKAIKILIDEKLISGERAKSRKFVDLDKMKDSFYNRRASSWQSLISEWYSLMKTDIKNIFVYSKETPQIRLRKVEKYR